MKDEELIYEVADMVADAELLTSTAIAKEIIELVRGSEWVSVEEFQQEPNEGECFILYKGRVVFAYHDHRERFMFGKYSNNCYMTECISAVMPIVIPSPPTNKGDK